MRALLLLALPRKCLGFSVVPQVSCFQCGGTIMLFLVWGTRHGSLSRGGARFRVRDNSWYFCLVFVIAPPPPPGRRGQNTCKIRPFSGRLVFSRALMHAGWRMHKK